MIMVISTLNENLILLEEAQKDRGCWRLGEQTVNITFSSNDLMGVRKWRTISPLHGFDLLPATWATFAWQRCAELSYARRRAGRESCPAHGVGVVAFEQSSPLLWAGELSKPAAGLVVPGCCGDGPAHWALSFELWVLSFGGCKDKKTQKTIGVN